MKFIHITFCIASFLFYLIAAVFTTVVLIEDKHIEHNQLLACISAGLFLYGFIALMRFVISRV